MQKISLFLLFIAVISCASGNNNSEKKEVVEEVKKTNVLEEDPFFKKPVTGNEVFRVLITNEGYYFKQVAGQDNIQRKPDVAGDREQFQVFRGFAEKYDFKEWDEYGILRVRLNVHRGEIEHIEFLPHKNPRSWQIAKILQEDVSRYSFVFPKKHVTQRDFWIHYNWRIPRRPGMSEQEARERAIEFMKSQVRPY